MSLLADTAPFFPYNCRYLTGGLRRRNKNKVCMPLNSVNINLKRLNKLHHSTASQLINIEQGKLRQ